MTSGMQISGEYTESAVTRFYGYNDYSQMLTEAVGDRLSNPVRTYDYFDNGLVKSIVEDYVSEIEEEVDGTTAVAINIETEREQYFDYDQRGLKVKEHAVETSVTNRMGEWVEDEVFISDLNTELGTKTVYVWQASESPVYQSTRSITYTTYSDYDELGRLVRVESPADTIIPGSAEEVNGEFVTDLEYLRYGYDAVGNREYIASFARPPSLSLGTNGSISESHKWFAYDAEGRVLIEDGSLDAENNRVVSVDLSKEYQYDKSGRVRNTAEVRDGTDHGPYSTTLSENLFASEHLPGYDSILVKGVNNNYFTRYYNPEDLAIRGQILSAEESRFFGGFHVVIDPAPVEAAIFTRSVQYDDLDRQIAGEGESTGPWTAKYNNRGFQIEFDGRGGRTESRYGADGRMLEQVNYTSTGNKSVTLYNLEDSYDQAGNLKHYQVVNYESNGDVDYRLEYRNDYDIVNGEYKVTSKHLERGEGASSSIKPSVSTFVYDFWGNNTKVYIGGDDGGEKTFIYDGQGRILSALEEYGDLDNATGQFERTKATSYFYQGSNYLGSAWSERTNHDEATVLSTGYSASWDTGSDFANGVAHEAGPMPGSYTVTGGETLQSIAFSIFGDSSLWYVIADANSLQKGPSEFFDQADVGRTLIVPNVPATLKNNASTFKPYNPGEIIGDTTPTMTVAPPSDKGCNTIAMIIVIIVVIIVTIYTAGATTGAAGTVSTSTATTAGTTTGATAGAGATTGATVGASSGAGALAGGTGATITVTATSGAKAFSTGLAALAGGTAGSVSVSSGAALLGATVGGVAGSVAGQLVGKALGVRDSFSLREAIASGVGAGITAGAGAIGSAGFTGAQALGGTVGAFSGVAAAKVAGLDTSFSWRTFAAQQFGATVGSVVGDAVGVMTRNSLAQGFAAGLSASATAGYMNRQISGGGRVDLGMIAVDAFGNSLANSLVGKIQQDSQSNLVNQQQEQQSNHSASDEAFTKAINDHNDGLISDAQYRQAVQEYEQRQIALGKGGNGNGRGGGGLPFDEEVVVTAEQQAFENRSNYELYTRIVSDNVARQTVANRSEAFISSVEQSRADFWMQAAQEANFRRQNDLRAQREFAELNQATYERFARARITDRDIAFASEMKGWNEFTDVAVGIAAGSTLLLGGGGALALRGAAGLARGTIFTGRALGNGISAGGRALASEASLIGNFARAGSSRLGGVVNYAKFRANGLGELTLGVFDTMTGGALGAGAVTLSAEMTAIYGMGTAAVGAALRYGDEFARTFNNFTDDLARGIGNIRNDVVRFVDNLPFEIQRVTTTGMFDPQIRVVLKQGANGKSGGWPAKDRLNSSGPQATRAEFQSLHDSLEWKLHPKTPQTKANPYDNYGAYVNERWEIENYMALKMGDRDFPQKLHSLKAGDLINGWEVKKAHRQVSETQAHLKKKNQVVYKFEKGNEQIIYHYNGHDPMGGLPRELPHIHVKQHGNSTETGEPSWYSVIKLKLREGHWR